jgi:hypothetical protein
LIRDTAADPLEARRRRENQGMSSTQLATIATIGWAILTLALLAIGTWGVGETWTILPGLVRGARDWAAEQAAASRAEGSTLGGGTFGRPPSSAPSLGPSRVTDPKRFDDRELEVGAGVEIEELGSRSI